MQLLTVLSLVYNEDKVTTDTDAFLLTILITSIRVLSITKKASDSCE